MVKNHVFWSCTLSDKNQAKLRRTIPDISDPIDQTPSTLVFLNFGLKTEISFFDSNRHAIVYTSQSSLWIQAFFMDLFRIPRPEGEVLIDGWLVVQLFDKTEDLNQLLTFLYKPLYVVISLFILYVAHWCLLYYLAVYTTCENLYHSRLSLRWFDLEIKYEFISLRDEGLKRPQTSFPVRPLFWTSVNENRFSLNRFIMPSLGIALEVINFAYKHSEFHPPGDFSEGLYRSWIGKLKCSFLVSKPWLISLLIAWNFMRHQSTRSSPSPWFWVDGDLPQKVAKCAVWQKKCLCNYHRITWLSE